MAEEEEDEIYADIELKTISHGHSTPEMAARFAHAIGLGSGDGSGGSGGVLGRMINDISSSDGHDTKVQITSKSRVKTKSKDNNTGTSGGGGKGKGILLLNHFSSRYADPRSSDEARDVMDKIRQCAVKEYAITAAAAGTASGDSRAEIEVVCAYDLMQYEIRARD